MDASVIGRIGDIWWRTVSFVSVMTGGDRRAMARQRGLELLDHRGQCVRRLCFYPKGRLTDGDIMLAQKVALEAFEVEALAIANKFPANMLNL